MGTRRLVLIAVVVGALGVPVAARADGVCVAIDAGRDNLADGERGAVRIAVLAALEREGVAVDRDGAACRTVVTVSSLRLGKGVTTTIVAGDGRSVSGRASSLDEVDLLVSQLVRSLVTGRSLATGRGVTDWGNVLRDQTAPRRVDARASRRWDPVFAAGGGMLQLPATGARGRQRRSDIVTLEARRWGFLTGEQDAIELVGRVLLHDYAVFGAATGAYRDSEADPDDGPAQLGRGFGVLASPLAVANWEGGIGFVHLFGARAPRPYVRLGGSVGVLCRFSDPDHYVDLGLGLYGGLGLQLSRRLSVSVAVNASNPVVHDFLDHGYRYFLTTTAMLEVRGEGRDAPPPALFGPEPIPTRRVIAD